MTLASGDSGADSIRLALDVRLRMTLLAEGGRRTLDLDPGRRAWIHVVRGGTSLGGSPLGEGDGVAISEEPSVAFEGGDAELLAFDLE